MEAVRAGEQKINVKQNGYNINTFITLNQNDNFESSNHYIFNNKTLFVSLGLTFPVRRV